MITPTASDARKLVNLAERMGIATEDAIHRVVMRITERPLSQNVVRTPWASPTDLSVGPEHTDDDRDNGCAPERERRMEGMNETKDELLTLSEVATIFRVAPKTVTRWAKDGKLDSIRTLGGDRRFRTSEVRRVLEEGAQENN